MGPKKRPLDAGHEVPLPAGRDACAQRCAAQLARARLPRGRRVPGPRAPTCVLVGWRALVSARLTRLYAARAAACTRIDGGAGCSAALGRGARGALLAPVRPSAGRAAVPLQQFAGGCAPRLTRVRCAAGRERRTNWHRLGAGRRVARLPRASRAARRPIRVPSPVACPVCGGANGIRISSLPGCSGHAASRIPPWCDYVQGEPALTCCSLPCAPRLIFTVLTRDPTCSRAGGGQAAAAVCASNVASPGAASAAHGTGWCWCLLGELLMRSDSAETLTGWGNAGVQIVQAVAQRCANLLRPDVDEEEACEHLVVEAITLGDFATEPLAPCTHTGARV